MSTISERIREERESLGLDQAVFGRLGGVARSAQSRYETGTTSPDAEYLRRLSDEGVDVVYILLGRRSGSGLKIDLEKFKSIQAGFAERVPKWRIWPEHVALVYNRLIDLAKEEDAWSKEVHEEINYIAEAVPQYAAMQPEDGESQ